MGLITFGALGQFGLDIEVPVLHPWWAGYLVAPDTVSGRHHMPQRPEVLDSMLLNELQKEHQQVQQQTETIQRLESRLARPFSPNL